MVTGWPSMALTGLDMGFDQGFITDSMLRVGFKSVLSRALELPMGPMDLDIERKQKRFGRFGCLWRRTEYHGD